MILGKMPSIVLESSSATEPINGEGKGKGRTHIYLNIYDLTPVNDYLYWFGFGIFHSGIEGKILIPFYVYFYGFLLLFVGLRLVIYRNN